MLVDKKSEIFKISIEKIQELLAVVDYWIPERGFPDQGPFAGIDGNYTTLTKKILNVKDFDACLEYLDCIQNDHLH